MEKLKEIQTVEKELSYYEYERKFPDPYLPDRNDDDF